MQWIELLASFAESGELVDWGKASQWIGYDVISELVFGEPFGFSVAGEDKYSLLSQVVKSLPIVGPLVRMPYLLESIVKIPLLRDWILPTPWDKNGLGRLMAFHNELVNERISKEARGASGGKRDILAQCVFPPRPPPVLTPAASSTRKPPPAPRSHAKRSYQRRL